MPEVHVSTEALTRGHPDIHTVNKRCMVLSYWAVCPSTGECPHLISEGAETAGTTWGRVPSDQ